MKQILQRALFISVIVIASVLGIACNKESPTSTGDCGHYYNHQLYLDQGDCYYFDDQGDIVYVDIFQCDC